MKPLVAPQFKVPLGAETPFFCIKPLSEEFAELDFQAVMASKARLGRIFSGAWPNDVHSREDNLRDIREHVEDARKRIGFTYTVLSLDEVRCWGCIYIYPSSKQGFDAAVHYWVHIELMESLFEKHFSEFVDGWIKSTWPFERVAYPGRTLSWESWRNLPPKICS